MLGKPRRTGRGERGDAANASTHNGRRIMRWASVYQLDPQAPAAIAIKRIERALMTDLGARGPNDLSTQQRLLVHQVAVQTVVLQTMEGYGFDHGVIANGELLAVFGKSYVAWSNAQRRTLEALGLERRAREVDDLRTLLGAPVRENGSADG